MNPKKDKYKETHTYACYGQIADNQRKRENLTRSQGEKWHLIYRRKLYKCQHPSKNMEARIQWNKNVRYAGENKKLKLSIQNSVYNKNIPQKPRWRISSSTQDGGTRANYFLFWNN